MSTKCHRQKPSACMCVNVRRASRAVTRIYDQALEPSGLKVTQFSLLKNIEAHGPLNISTLAKVLMLDRTTLVRNLKPLENAGFIENSPSADPRERQVGITGQGRVVVKAALPRWQEVQRQMAGHIGAENMQLLAQLASALEDLAGGHETFPE
ncbi:MarR family winged helix-turn-helix transcriptional regulator [Geobacter sp. SVR]|uniref:MarR family winged helix-turn-helix transcriptional regulator n=1 Tax=Geobacter sp. SVR TaxID=2495594 RepID=UPI001563CE0A|nr:MarR family winged helix-turn-helix transcriptional regulator [Geobacter sp. SVR]